VVGVPGQRRSPRLRELAARHDVIHVGCWSAADAAPRMRAQELSAARAPRSVVAALRRGWSLGVATAVPIAAPPRAEQCRAPGLRTRSQRCIGHTGSPPLGAITPAVRARQGDSGRALELTPLSGVSGALFSWEHAKRVEDARGACRPDPAAPERVDCLRARHVGVRVAALPSSGGEGGGQQKTSLVPPLEGAPGDSGEAGGGC
jgi:hypothetical protein